MNKKLAAKIFIIASIVIFLGLCGFYGYRLIHYYKLEHPKVENEKNFASVLTEPSNIVVVGDGLYQEEKNYYYKGNVSNNYVTYSGILWRILEINGTNITMISDEALTSMVLGYESSKYQDSYVEKWLNEDFYQVLKNEEKYLVETSYCVDVIKDSNNVSCKEKEKSKVGLLSVSAYLKAGGSKSYLSKNSSFWTANPSQENKFWFVNSKGLVADESITDGSYHSYGVRPVITVKGDLPLISGNGTMDDPYCFEKNDATILKEETVGSYISYSDQVWKIIGMDEMGVKLALNGYVTMNGNEMKRSFSDDSNLYSIQSKDNLGYYLNSTYFRSLKNREYLVEYPWEVSYYNKEQKYNYKASSVETVKTEIGLLQVGDLFLNDFSGYVLITPSGEDDGTIFTVKEDGRLYADLVTEELKVRPAIVLKGDLKITGGVGTVEQPFTLGVS